MHVLHGTLAHIAACLVLIGATFVFFCVLAAGLLIEGSYKKGKRL